MILIFRVCGRELCEAFHTDKIRHSTLYGVLCLVFI